jgi:hypothetical protein
MKNIYDTFCYDHFFIEDDLAIIESAIVKNTVETLPDYSGTNGLYSGRDVLHMIDLIKDDESVNMMKNKLSDLFDISKTDFDISALAHMKLLMPFDVHADWKAHKVAPGFTPLFVFLVPLEDAESRTIIFDQCTTGSDRFSDYKATAKEIPNAIDKEFWDTHLSSCWEEDRKYLSIKKIMPYQRRGQLQGFKRELYHSSDNFKKENIESKSYLHMRMDVKIGISVA